MHFPGVAAFVFNAHAFVIAFEFFVTQAIDVTGEIAMDVFFGLQVGAPRGHATRTVVHAAKYFAAAWVGTGFHGFVAGGGAGNVIGGVHVGAPVLFGARVIAP